MALWMQPYPGQLIPTHRFVCSFGCFHASCGSKGWPSSHSPAWCKVTHAKWLIEDSMMRCSQSRCRWSCHWSRTQQHSKASWHASPPLRLPHLQWEDEWLHCSFSSLHLQLQQGGSQERLANLVQPEIVPTSTARHLGSLPRSTLKCFPPDPATKQVQFDLSDNLGDTPQLPADLASFLEEDITNKWNDAQHPLPPQSQAHRCFQRGIQTSDVPPLLEEPSLRPALSHQPDPQLPVGPSPDIVQHKTQWNAWGNGSRLTWPRHDTP